MVQRFVRIPVRVAAADAGRVAAEAYEAGASGLEERDDVGSGFTWLDLYAPAERASTVVAVLRQVLGPDGRIAAVTPVEPVDWASTWRSAHPAIEVSARLRIRPPFVPAASRAGQVEVVIEPGQAFGTGAHGSTRLALELLAELPEAAIRGTRVLDVGTGSGVLALAALRLGAREAVAFDRDPLAAPAARANARANDLVSGLRLFTGTLEALRPILFDQIVANLLRTELEPLLAGVAPLLHPDGHAVFSGLLAEECAGFEAALDRAGLAPITSRTLLDAAGDEWLGLVAIRRLRAGVPS